MKIIGICLCLWFTSIEKLIAEECSNSTTNNWIAISSDCSKEKCPVPIPERPSFGDSNKLRRKSSKYYSKICTNQLKSHPAVGRGTHTTQPGFTFGLRKNSKAKKPIDFKRNCGSGGNACQSRTTIVDYQQCYPG